MHSNAIFTFIALAMTFILPASADTLVAYSGGSCDGSSGDTVQCDDSCHQFTGRHSLKISGGSAHCVNFYSGNDCLPAGKDVPTVARVGSDVCYNVNTGGPVLSFKCAPTAMRCSLPPPQLNA